MESDGACFNVQFLQRRAVLVVQRRIPELFLALALKQIPGISTMGLQRNLYLIPATVSGNLGRIRNVSASLWNEWVRCFLLSQLLITLPIHNMLVSIECKPAIVRIGFCHNEHRFSTCASVAPFIFSQFQPSRDISLLLHFHMVCCRIGIMSQKCSR